MTYQIKTANLQEIQLMLEWARAEGWNPGLDDALTFAQADPNGFFVGLVENKPVAAISNVKYNAEFSFLGLYIVKPEFRGQGLGYKIWQHALNYSGSANCALDGVIEQQANYIKSGFKLEQRNIRYALGKNNISSAIDRHLQSITEANLDLTLDYDKDFFPVPRGRFLTSWLFALHAKAFTYFAGGKIHGYGVIRKCHNGYKVGPLFADSQEVATVLFQGLCSSVEQNQNIFIDIPEPNLKAKALMQDFNLSPVFETARMYTKQIPNISMQCTYGITTFEIG